MWRIAYVEGGPFVDYQKILRGIALGLQRMGLIENGDVPVPENSEDVSAMWAWLSANAGGTDAALPSGRLLFGGLGRRNPAGKPRKTAHSHQGAAGCGYGACLRYLGGQDLASADIDIPVVVASVTNAVEAGIIPSVEDSGRDNLVAVIEPERFKHQVMLFHDIFKFKKLGIAYEDSSSGRSSIALNELESASRELGVELLVCNDIFDVDDPALAAARLKSCSRQARGTGCRRGISYL